MDKLETISQWIEDTLKVCAERESFLLGNTHVKGWEIQLNYTLGRRDTLWALQRLLKKGDEDEHSHC